MTRTQFRRMTVFALRMVPIAIGGGRWQKAVREHVLEILERMNCPNFNLEYRYIIDWSNSEYWTREEADAAGRSPYWTRQKAEYMCDHLSTYCWDERLEREREDSKGNLTTIDTKVGVALRCCLRAALDIAVGDSGGVLGFSIGDLRRMWGKRPIPKWVGSDWRNGEGQPVDINNPEQVPAEAGIWL